MCNVHLWKRGVELEEDEREEENEKEEKGEKEDDVDETKMNINNNKKMLKMGVNTRRGKNHDVSKRG